MGLTEEKIKIEVTLNCEYKFKGKKLDITNLENLEKNIKDSLLETLYNTIENELYCNDVEEFKEIGENWEIKIK